jgi:PPP family 3-phenylpropionic acid transporter
MSRADPVPYWRLSAHYFFYYLTVGAFMPYWTLYLQARGFDAVAIGQLMALVAVTKIVAPYVWGWLADHGYRRMPMIRYASCLTALTFAAILFVSGFVWTACIMLLFSFFWNAGLPQFEATTLNFLGDNHHRYSGIRSWGSLGFIVAVFMTGFFLDVAGLQKLPYVLLPLYLLVWLSTLLVPQEIVKEPAHPAVERSIRPLLQRRSVQLILLAGFLMQLSFGPYYTFFSIHLEAYGYSKSAVGALWVLGVVSEIVIFLVMHRLLPAYDTVKLLLWCFALTVLRWLLIGFAVDYLPLLLLAQCLHAFSFGMFHAVMIHWIHQAFKGVHQGRGQALYTSLSFGAGAALGALVSGYCWQIHGGARCFAAAACIAGLGLLVVGFARPRTAGTRAKLR